MHARSPKRASPKPAVFKETAKLARKGRQLSIAPMRESGPADRLWESFRAEFVRKKT